MDQEKCTACNGQGGRWVVDKEDYEGNGKVAHGRTRWERCAGRNGIGQK